MKNSFTKLITLLLLIILLVCSCGKEEEVPDLDGTWKETEQSHATMDQEAVISGDTIQVFWINDSDNSHTIYWSGSFTPPTTPEQPYTWESTSNLADSMAILASPDKTKKFTYEDGKITYDVTVMGTVTKVELEKVDAENVHVTEIDPNFIATNPNSSGQDFLPSTEYTVGEVLDFNGLKITLNKVTQYSSFDDYIEPTEGNIYLVCNFTVNNDSEESQYISDYDFDGYVNDTSVTKAYAPDTIGKSLSGNIAPGKKLEGIVSYEVPTDWSNFEVIYKANSSNDQTFTFKITPDQVTQA